MTAPDPDEARAYTTAIIVAYSRPFSGNRDRHGKRDTIDERYVRTLSSPQRAVHDRVVGLRNSTFAHSDASAHDVRVTDTKDGGLVTLSHDPLVPLEKSEVECLLTNMCMFRELNEQLRKDAAAAHLFKRK